MKLKHLILCSDSELTFTEMMTVAHMHLPHLKSLDMINLRAIIGWNLCASFAAFSNLTRLRLSEFTSVVMKQSDVRCIEDLDVPLSSLVNEEGVILFPSLTNLTKLNLEINTSSRFEFLQARQDCFSSD